MTTEESINLLFTGKKKKLTLDLTVIQRRRGYSVESV